MLPCATCGSHHRRTDRRCPHCGAAASAGGPARTAAAALLGLAVACSGKEPATSETGDTDTPTITSPEPEYGVVITTTGETADTGATSGVDYGTSTTSSTDSGTSVEPLYGVTTTGGSGK